MSKAHRELFKKIKDMKLPTLKELLAEEKELKQKKPVK